MLYWLSFLSDQFNALNVFRYITVRTGGAMITALVFVFLFGPMIIDKLRTLQGKGQPIRTDGPQSHLVTKKGTPTMGGLMILLGIIGGDGAVGQPGQQLCVDRARRDADASARSASTTTTSRSRGRPMPAFPESSASSSKSWSRWPLATSSCRSGASRSHRR